MGAQPRSSRWWQFTIIALIAFPLACRLLNPSRVYDDPDPGGNPPVDPPRGQNHGPTSQIVAPLTGDTDADIGVQNRATDPDGDAIIAYRFRTPEQNITQSGNVAQLRFANAGSFRIFMSAQDSRQLWGSEISSSITISRVAPLPQILFTDNGTLPPTEAGYAYGVPRSGLATLSIRDGVRTTNHEGGVGAYGYSHRAVQTIPRGARIRMRFRPTVDFRDPLAETTAEDIAYSGIDISFYDRTRDTGVHYFVVARNDPLYRERIGHPPIDVLENRLTPGKHVLDRAANREWVVRDLDLDRIIATMITTITPERVVGVTWRLYTFDLHGRGNLYNKRLEVDYVELYVPSTP